MKKKSVDCIYVGDTRSDVLAAHNAGVYSVAYLSNPSREQELTSVHPNKLVTDLSEIEDVLKEDISWTYNMR